MRLFKIRLFVAAFLFVNLCVSCLSRTPILAQSSTARPDRPEFEVASIKLHRTDEGPRGISFSPSGRFAWSRMTLKQLMGSAYAELPHAQIVGGPGWTDSDRFDIVATSAEALQDMGPDGSPRGLFRRLRTLLEDRFRLKTHVESRDLPIYALQTVSSTPTAVGSHLRKTDIDCEAVLRDAAAGRRPNTPEGQQPPCSMRLGGPGQLMGHAITMDQVGGVLSGRAGRPVVNRTGLAGNFDVDLKWAAEFPSDAPLNGAPAPANDGPSIFTAVREQLGLKLEATRARMPVLVIDAAQLPTPD
jgi:uncharacterized protein (TIGR03435 family)